MPNQEIRAGSTVIKIDGVVVARITSVEKTYDMTTADGTGTENVSGGLVQRQRIPVVVDETYRIGGVLISGEGESTPQDLEPGQQDLRAKMRAGTECTLEWTKPSGFGEQAVGYISNFTEGFSGVEALHEFSADFLVNSTTPVTP